MRLKSKSVEERSFVETSFIPAASLFTNLSIFTDVDVDGVVDGVVVVKVEVEVTQDQSVPKLTDKK